MIGPTGRSSDSAAPGTGNGSQGAAVAAGGRSEFRAVTGLKYLGAFFAGGIGLSGLYAASGLGIPCPLFTLTGWQCPLCGSTRLGDALLHGDIASAFAYNPAVFIGLGVLTVIGVAWIVEALGGARIRPPAPIATVLRRITVTRWLVAALVFSVLYLLGRNLL